MRIKYNGKSINVENQSDKPKKEFFTTWEDYIIEVIPDKQTNFYNKNKDAWVALCTAPDGCYIVDGIFHGTMRDIVQICFENIEYGNDEVTLGISE